MADLKGLKRICMSCGARFYDLNKKPIICPSCSTEFTGEIKVKTRRGRLPAEVADAPEEIEDDVAIEKEEAETEEAESDEETVSLEEISEDEDDADEEDEDLLGDDDIDIDDEDLDDLDDEDDDIDEDIAEEDEEK